MDAARHFLYVYRTTVIALYSCQPVFQLFDPFIKPGHDFQYRVWQPLMAQFHIWPTIHPIDFDHPARYADHRGSWGHGLDHHRTGANLRPIANGNRAQHYGIRTQYHVIADSRVTLGFLSGNATQNHPFIHQHIIADFRRLTDYHTHAMVNEKPSANNRTGVDLDAGQETAHM